MMLKGNDCVVSKVTIEGACLNADALSDYQQEMSISEIVGARLFAIQTHTELELDVFCKATLQQAVAIGNFAIFESKTWLRYGPNILLIVASGLPADTRSIESSQYCTEVSHGKSLLTISGTNVREFFKDYCSADIGSFNANQYGLYKALFLDYKVLVWQDSKDILQVLMDRSYAHSFVRLLATLLQRRATMQ